MTLSRLMIFGALCVGFLTTSLVGAVSVAPQATKKDLTDKEKAEIDVEVTRRLLRLQRADTPDTRSKARAEIVDTAKIPGATSRFLTEYARVSSSKLAGLMSDPNRLTALEAVLVLSDLDRPEVIAGYVSGLSSPHQGVRYK